MSAYEEIIHLCQEYNTTLVAVSKTKSADEIKAIYDKGQRHFGENRVQELVEKYHLLPKDIKWHLIGHLQKNKVKYVAPFVHLIHSVDSASLLKTINKEAVKINRKIDVLLQVKIAEEESKFGLSFLNAEDIISDYQDGLFPNIQILGLMGMATFTSNTEMVKDEFLKLAKFRNSLEANRKISLPEISMGMSGDYKIALECGSTMLRVGSLIFGKR